jgi:tannase/feruloyl esterase
MRFPILVLGLLCASAPARGQTPDAACEKLAALKIENAMLVAGTVPAGQFKPPPSPPGGMPSMPQAFANLPAMCRVTGTLKPSSDSDITVEVWLPIENWNGKLQGVGNGGWAGSIFYFLMANALRSGYAVVATDTGHVGGMGDGAFAFNHPEKVTDFAWRAVHEMTVVAKALIESYYGKAPRLSYWNGCSTGGRQGLKEAQRYPSDYDGILDGAPANFMTHLATHSLWVAHATLKDQASYIPKDKFATLHKAVLDACDGLDGVKDGVLENPRQCKFDPKSIECAAGTDTSACLTAPQVDAARKIYGPARNPRTGAEIFPGLERGSEMGWGALAAGPGPLSISADHFKYIVFGNPDWDYKTLDFDRDVAKADQVDNGLLNATSPNLRAFFNRGGKILMYHGWNDQLIAPGNSINYYNSVVKELGLETVSKSMRLFMAPGMDHCFGGDGPNVFDGMAALERWVEQHEAPEQLIASHIANGKPDRTRPLCLYPKVAVYSGTASTDDAANFVCKAQP